MQSQHLIIIGLSLEIIGAFFVAVEAIKLRNLRLLRDKYLKKFHHKTLSPRIEHKDGYLITHASKKYVFVFTLLHHLAGIIILLVINLATSGGIKKLFLAVFRWWIDRSWYLLILFGIIFIFYGIYFGLWFLGEIFHVALTKSFQLSIKILDFIDLHTPDGTIGILGFAFLFLGFIMQTFGVIKSL